MYIYICELLCTWVFSRLMIEINYILNICYLKCNCLAIGLFWALKKKLKGFPPPPLPLFLLFFSGLSMTGLILIALGTGGIKPCVSAFGGDQFEDDQVTMSLRLSFIQMLLLMFACCNTLIIHIFRYVLQCCSVSWVAEEGARQLFVLNCSNRAADWRGSG